MLSAHRVPIMLAVNSNATTSVSSRNVRESQDVNNSKHVSITMKKSHASQIYHCPVEGCVYAGECSRYFTHKQYLKQHIRKVHEEKNFICDKCKKGFSNHNQLNRHALVCGNVYQCSTCGIQYSTKEALQTHCRRKLHLYINDGHEKKRASKRMPLTNVVPPCFVVVIAPPNMTSKFSNMATPMTRPILPKQEIATVNNDLREAVRQTVTKSKAVLNDTAVQTEEIRCSDKTVGRKSTSAKRSHNLRYVKSTKLVSSSTQSVDCRVQNERRTLCDKSIQTDSEMSLREDVNKVFENSMTQTEISSYYYVNPSSVRIPEDIFVPDFENVNNHMWSCTQPNSTTNTHKSIQTLDELDVDTRFPLFPPVTASTQTSPRCKVDPAAVCNNRMFDSSFNKYLGIDLGNLHDFNSVFPTSPRYFNLPLLTTDNSLKLLNCETQTDQNLSDCLNLGEDDQSNSDIDVEQVLSYDIHTQTPKDLDSIPYEQLLINMETQTTNQFFLSEFGLCDIETQTAMLRQNDSVGLVDTHTQTNFNLRQYVHSSDMETQTLIVPQLESELMDSHTQTNYLDIFNEY